MGEIDDGGPAYPWGELNDDGSHYHQHPGMSLRDCFAAHALQGLIAGRRQFGSDGLWRGPQKVAEEAYGLADAMLRARARSTP